MRPVFELRPHQQRGLDAMEQHQLGQLVMPTGAGKTPTMIFDAIRQFLKDTPQTIVVCCPRILLAEQLSSEFLEFITNAQVLHVHSGETHHFSSTRPNVTSAAATAAQGAMIREQQKVEQQMNNTGNTRQFMPRPQTPINPKAMSN